jgi:hypothetical protein
MASLFASSEVYARAALMRNSHISLGTLREKDTGPLFSLAKKATFSHSSLVEIATMRRREAGSDARQLGSGQI